MKKYRVLSFNDNHRVDHGVEQLENSVAAVTLCGRKIKTPGQWFLRGHQEFNGKEGFYCKTCCRRFAKAEK